ncbi:MAG: helix-turn-helix domain-containing protein [Patescibacteria group bacterium]|nr:helix-turn-helix domain-containing protein [Patescibacteria group bacterium]
MNNNQQSNQPIKQFLSIGEAASYLGVSIDTLRRWTKAGKISDARSPGGHRYFRKTDLDNLFNTKYERYNEPKPKNTISLDAKESDNSHSKNNFKIVINEIQKDPILSENLISNQETNIEMQYQNNNANIQDYRHTRPTRKILVPQTPVISIRKSASISFLNANQNNLSATMNYGSGLVANIIAKSENKTQEIKNKENIKNLKRIFLIILAIFILADIIFIIFWYFNP